MDGCFLMGGEERDDQIRGVRAPGVYTWLHRWDAVRANTWEHDMYGIGIHVGTGRGM